VIYLLHLLLGIQGHAAVGPPCESLKLKCKIVDTGLDLESNQSAMARSLLPYAVFTLGDVKLHQLHAAEGKVRQPEIIHTLSLKFSSSLTGFVLSMYVPWLRTCKIQCALATLSSLITKHAANEPAYRHAL
jgi:hypothetical protein